MRLSRTLSLWLALCLLLATLSVPALGEALEITSVEAEDTAEDIVEDTVEEIVHSDAVPNLAAEAGLEGADIAPTMEAEAPDAAAAESAEASAIGYARVKCADAPVFFDPNGTAAIAALAKGEVVLITGDTDGLTPVALNLGGLIVRGYMFASDIAALSPKKTKSYIANLSGNGVALYNGDASWPLGALSAATKTCEYVTNAANYTELDNTTAFTINGKVIRASDEPTKGPHNCWAWAQVIYKKIWGTGFDSTFEGTASKGHNLARKLSDEERLLTAKNVEYIVSHAKPGATIRVQACPSTCSGFNTDGCSKHNKHSLIIAEIREDGFVTMDDQGTVPHTRYYTWQGFCNAWKNWVYVKYVKWPNAPALSSQDNRVKVTGVTLDKTSVALIKGNTATLKAGIEPADATNQNVSWTSSDAAVATVKDGVVTAVGAGKATITVTTSDGGLTATCAVTVPNADYGKDLTRTGSNGTVKLPVGKRLQLAASFATSKGWKLKSVSSSNSKYASVSKSGLVTAKKVGTTTITVKTKNGKKATLKVKVVKSSGDSGDTGDTTGTQPTKLILSKTGTVKLKKGSVGQLTVTLEPAGATTTLTWKSSNEKVAWVDQNGKVYGLKKGTCKIGVWAENGVYAIVTVKVV